MELDPYWKWLGIPPEQQPPNHYVLLGIALFEADRDVIENAAVRQMSHVRTFQGGQHAAASQQLLNELSAVRLCLLNEEQKQAYDEQLQARLSVTHSSQELPVATSQLPVAQEVAEVSIPHRAPRRSRRRRQRRNARESQLAWTVILFVVVALLVCVSIGIFIYRSQRSDESSNRKSLRFHHLSLIDNRCLDNAC
ncbi:MAG: hypothetical protein VX715_10000 [Planctomycetota bacterium]|nr:hypothetical protein [Planctomycetota bacterium]